MSYRATASAALEQWSPAAFLAAGGLFLLPTVVFGLNAVTGTEIAVSPAVVFAFMLVVFVGLLGLYPRLAGRDSTLALGGVGLLALTAAVIVSTLGFPVLPAGPALGKSAVLAIIMTVVIGSVLIFTTFGVAILRTGAHSRRVGHSLLVMAAGLVFMVGATLLDGAPAPAWVSFAVNGLFSISLGAVGFRTYNGSIITESTEQSGNSTAS